MIAGQHQAKLRPSGCAANAVDNVVTLYARCFSAIFLRFSNNHVS